MTTYGEIATARRSRLSRKMRIALFFLVETVAALAIGFAALFLSFEPLWSAEGPPAALTKPGDARSGSLLFKTDDGYADAPRLGIDVDLTVSGPTIRARVTQIFKNPTQNWMEATYVYPLPPGGAVDTLKMVVGDRVVVGDIKERQQARVIYEQARASGQKAALTEQERPNIFTNSLANIGPGETVLVQIEYQEPVSQTGNEFSLRVPMVVGPRYNPLPVVQSVDLRLTQRLGREQRRSRRRSRPHLAARARPRAKWAHQPDQHHGSSAGRLSAWRGQKPSSRRQDREPGCRDPHHQPRRRRGAGRSRLRADLEAGRRDRALGRIVPRACRQRRLSVGLRHAAGGRTGRREAAAARSGVRDRQFRLDGRHVDRRRPRRACSTRLGRLQPNDRFNVIRFDDTMDVLFPASVPVDAEHLDRAISFVRALQARGGTEMVPAMRAALTDTAGSDTRGPRPSGRVPDRRRDRQRTAAVRDHHGDARPLARVHDRDRFGTQHLSDDARRRTRPRRLHPYRFGRPGRGTHARPVRQTGKSGGDRALREILRRGSGYHAGRHSRRLSRRAAGTGGEARQACRLGRDQGKDRRPALGRHPAARQCGRRQGPVKALGAAQDQRRRGRAHPAAGEPGGGRQDHPGARAGTSARDPVDQSRCRRPDAEPSRRRAAQACGAADQPAGRLGF